MRPARSPRSDRSESRRPNRGTGARRGAAALLVALLAGGLGACIETTVERTDLGDGRVRQVPVSGAFEVRQGGVAVGQVQRYGDPASAQEHYFVVMNVWGQELGIVDGWGRVWRRRPHEPRPEALGSGPLVDGVRRLLGLEAAVELVATGGADRARERHP